MNDYWIASRSIDTTIDKGEFCVNYVFGNNVYIGNSGVCYYWGRFIERDLSKSIRPIVTLKENVIDLFNKENDSEGVNIWHLR